MLRRVLAALLLTGAAVFPAAAQSDADESVLVGRVTRILDGDTLDVLLEDDDETTTIRMQGIDPPETDQPMTDDAVALLTG
jgi:endonuclease YncB( thermonuclease family)